jgi:hypothetical protein
MHRNSCCSSIRTVLKRPGESRGFAVLTDSTPLLRLNTGGEGGIRTLDTGVSPYNGLANRRLQPLGHLSGEVNRRDCNSLPRASPFIWCTLARISRHAGGFRMQTLRRINLARSAMGFAKSVNVRRLLYIVKYIAGRVRPSQWPWTSSDSRTSRGESHAYL